VTPNTKHLLKWWAVIIIVGGSLLVGISFGLTSALRRGDYTPVIALAVGVAVAAFSVLRSRRKALTLFKESSPDRPIAFYHSSTKRIPNGKALGAYLSAFAAVLYGQFDRAREELASINWATLPPMYQGFETYIHSLLAIFESQDYSRALLLAEEARDLSEASKNVPGVATSRASHDANVAVCELLTGKSSPELLSRLDRASRDLPGVAPAIPSWALATYHAQAQQSEAAERYMSIVRRLIPHSILLRDMQVNRGA
jgi:hypothetical protein